MKTRKDSFTTLINNLTGLGTDRDSSRHTGIRDMRALLDDRDILDHHYSNVWQCDKVCYYLPTQAASVWGEVTLEETSIGIPKQFNKLVESLKSIYKEGQVLANLYGGSVVVRHIDDGREYDEEVDLDNIKSIEYSRVFDRWEVTPDPSSLWENPSDPEKYMFFTAANKDIPNVIHKSRILRFRGHYLPPQLMREHQWEDSLLVSFVAPLYRYLVGMSHVGEALSSFEFIVFKFANLFNKLSGIEATKAEADLLRRMELLQVQLSSMKGSAIDLEEEDVEMISRNFSNVDNILTFLKEEMIAASGLTKPQFYQEHPAGFAATGKSEQAAEARALKQYMENKWNALVNRDILYLSKSFDIDTPFTWKWGSLYDLSQEDEVELDTKRIQGDIAYINAGVLTPQEVRESRFKSDNFAGIHVKIETDDDLSDRVKEERINMKNEVTLEKTDATPKINDGRDLDYTGEVSRSLYDIFMEQLEDLDEGDPAGEVLDSDD
jgi:phage-related protein (TIGR01555 family)